MVEIFLLLFADYLLTWSAEARAIFEGRDVSSILYERNFPLPIVYFAPVVFLKLNVVFFSHRLLLFTLTSNLSEFFECVSSVILFKGFTLSQFLKYLISCRVFHI